MRTQVRGLWDDLLPPRLRAAFNAPARDHHSGWVPDIVWSDEHGEQKVGDFKTGARCRTWFWGRFDKTVAMWSGTYADLEQAAGPASSGPRTSDARVPVDARRPWRTLDGGLDLPTAMHAHQAIAIPWLPFVP